MNRMVAPFGRKSITFLPPSASRNGNRALSFYRIRRWEGRYAPKGSK